MFDTGIRQVESTHLHGYGYVLAEKIMRTESYLNIEFKCCTQVVFTDVGSRESHGTAHIRYPGTVGDKIVSRADRTTNHVSSMGMKLTPCEKIAPDLEVALIPLALS